MLEIKNVTIKLEGKQIFQNLSFSVDKGQIVCVTGDSGAGKTTLLRAILGFVPLDDGTISIDGEMVTAASAETFRRIMSYVPQELSLPSEWVSEMVQMPFGIRANRSVKFSRARLIEEWKKLDLEESLYDSQVSKVSGGQRQRIMLAVSGMLNKPILLVDEPTSALDGTASSHVMDYFRNLAAGGTMIIAVTHDREFAEKCDKIININNGNN